MAFIPKPPFPNVPNLPGVPQLKRSSQFPPGPPPVLSGVIALGRLALAIITKPKWGIYKLDPTGGATTTDPVTGLDTLPEVHITPPILVPDNFSKFQFKNEWNVTTAPVQEGAFAAFNKTNNPFEITLRMTKGGSVADRQKFLDKLDTIAASLDAYKIVTPERTYLRCNITSYRVTRDGPKDAYFLTEVEITFIEIREVAAQYTNTAANTQNAKNPSAQPVVNRGTLNAITPASRVAAAIDSVLAPLRRLSSLIGN